MPLTNESPVIFNINLQDVNKKLIFEKVFCLSGSKNMKDPDNIERLSDLKDPKTYGTDFTDLDLQK
jgi:hypothetical protein